MTKHLFERIAESGAELERCRGRRDAAAEVYRTYADGYQERMSEYEEQLKSFAALCSELAKAVEGSIDEIGVITRIKTNE